MSIQAEVALLCPPRSCAWNLVLRSTSSVCLTSFDDWQELSHLMYHANLDVIVPKLSHRRLAGKTALD
jgi:hypothetical protein